MPLDPGVYCTEDDLLKGDLELPRYVGDGTSLVNLAAEDIDSHLGHIYVTPIEVLSTDPRFRATTLLLKRINRLLASGRLILDLATASEQSDLHAYGRSLMREAMELLDKIASGEMVLAGAERLPVPEGEEGSPSGPRIVNEDSQSLVQAFYDRYNPDNFFATDPKVIPYG